MLTPITLGIIHAHDISPLREAAINMTAVLMEIIAPHVGRLIVLPIDHSLHDPMIVAGHMMTAVSRKVARMSAGHMMTVVNLLVVRMIADSMMTVVRRTAVILPRKMITKTLITVISIAPDLRTETVKMIMTVIAAQIMIMAIRDTNGNLLFLGGLMLQTPMEQCVNT